MQFMTSDGYRLRRDGDKWSTQGGDTFDCGPDGHPVDCFGEAISGDYIPEMYLILIEQEVEEGIMAYQDSGEGPFDSHDDACDFARAEVGRAWMVVRVESAVTGEVMKDMQHRNDPLPGMLIQ